MDELNLKDELGSILRHNVPPFTHSYEDVTDEMMVDCIAALITKREKALLTGLMTGVKERAKEEGDDGCYQTIIGDIQSAINNLDKTPQEGEA